MQNLKRSTSILLAISLLLISLSPVANLQAKIKKPKSLKIEQQKLKSLPAFPEDAQRAPVDWSEVDWDLETTLPRDMEAYYKEKEELIARGKYEEAERLQPKKSRLSDEKTMERFRVPTGVQELVVEYKGKAGKGLGMKGKKQRLAEDSKQTGRMNRGQMTDEMKKELREKINLNQVSRRGFVGDNTNKGQKEQTKSQSGASLAITPTKNTNKETLIQEAELEKEEEEKLPELDISTQKIKKKLKKKTKKGKIGENEIETPKKPLMQRMFGDDEEGKIQEGMTLKKAKKKLKKNKKEKSALHNFIAPQAIAAETGSTTLIEYYNGIERHPIENILYYLSQNQNENGSFGNFKEYELTAKIALLLSQFNKNESDQYALTVDYLQNAQPQNNREKAMKARMMVGLEQPYTTLMDELTANQNADGGIGIKENYASDLETTLEFALALYITDTETDSALPAALHYIVNQIQTDGTIYYDAESASSLFLVNRSLETLQLFQDIYWEENGTQVTIQSKIDQMLNLLNFRYADLLENGDTIDQLMTLNSFQTYDFEPEKQEELREHVKWQQSLNGSFNNSLYSTVVAMQALPQSDILITNTEVASSLKNGENATFNITVRNQGYAIAKQIKISDFANGVVRNNTLDISGNFEDFKPQTEVVLTFIALYTDDLIGETEYKIYIEAEDESDYDNNWTTQTLTFASKSNNTPAMPANFMAQKATALSTQAPVYSVPAISLHWTYTEDPNRQNYIFMIRQQGETDWNYVPLDNSWNGVLVKGFDEEYLVENANYEVNLAVLHSDGVSVTHNPEQTIQVTTSSDKNTHIASASGTLVSGNETGGVSVDSYLSEDVTVNYNGDFKLENLGNGTTAAWVKETQYEKLKTRFPVSTSGTTEGIRVFTHLKADSIAPEIVSLEANLATVFPFKNQNEMEIMFDANDNVKVKETDFYLYHETDDYWEYLGTTTDNSSYNWYVPADTIGTGFKLKAIAWDYQNNSSTPLEWGPFEIIDGTVPPDSDIPVITTFEPRYGPVSTIKNQLEFQMWLQASDNAELARAELYLYKPVEAVWEKISEEIFSGSDAIFAWTPPVGMTGTGYKFKAIAWDAQNNESAPQEWGPFEIVDGSDLTGGMSILGIDGGVWSLGDTKVLQWNIDTPHTIEKIAQIAIYYDAEHYYTIFRDYESEATGQVSYTMPLSSFIVSPSAYISLLACDTATNCVTLNSEPFTIADNTPPPPEPWGTPQQVTGLIIDEFGLYRHFEHVQENADGSVEVIYNEYDGFSWQDQGEYRRIVYRKLVNGTWQAPLILKEYWYRDGQTDNIFNGEFFIKQVDSGNIHFIYTPRNWTTSAVPRINYIQIQNSSKVQDQEISSGSTEPSGGQLALSSSSKVYFTWREYDPSGGYHIKFRDFNGTTWSTIERLMYHGNSHALTVDQENPIVAYFHAGQIYLIKRESGTWSTPIPINRKDIKKSKLDQYSEDADKLNLIVEQDPNDESNYLWLPAVKTESELEAVLTNNNFVKATEILETWRLNEYVPDGIDYSLFSKGDNQYDLFYRNYNGVRTMNHLGFTINSQSNESTVTHFQELVPRVGSDYIHGYRVLKNDDQKYHVFYLKELENDMRHVGHLILDGEVAFNAQVSSTVMNVGDWLFASENNDNVTVYYGGTIAGSTALMLNTADYSSLLESSLRLESPENNSTTSTSLLLDWSADAGEFESYDLEFGLNPDFLSPIATNLQETQYSKEGLIANTNYYWRVTGHNTSGSISSSTQNFTTSAENHGSTFEFLTPWSEENPASESFKITWTDNDPEENAKISLYYDTDNSGYDGTLIAENINEDDPLDEYTWSTKRINEGTYYLYAVVSDGTNEPFKVYSNVSIKISFPACPSPINGDWNITKTCVLQSSKNYSSNLTVSSGATLLIDSETMLKINSGDYKISVEKGSSIKIVKGGKIKKTTDNNTNTPSFEFITPATQEITSGTGYLISWTDSDFEENMTISLYRDTNQIGFDGELITDNISENSEIDEYLWDVSEVENGDYYLYAVVTDGVNTPERYYSNGSVSISRSTCTPPVSGNWIISETCTLAENVTAPANIILGSGAILTIESGATLFFDSINHTLSGEQDSYVNVKDGGGIN